MGYVLQESHRRWLALTVVCLGQLMMVLDATIVNVALPSIQADLHFSPASLTWVIDAYMIAFGSFLLLAGRLGDLIGRKRVFLAGLVLFTAASVVCGLAHDQVLLVTARPIQDNAGLGLGQGLDVLGSVLVTLALMVGIYAIVEAPTAGWTSTHTLGWGV